MDEDGLPLEGQATRPRRTRGRPSPWLYLTMAVFASGLAAAAWILGEGLVFAIGWTVAAAGYFWASWYAKRHARDPLRPGRSATSRWGAGRPDERWH